MFDWLEDLGETVVDVGSQIAIDKHTKPKPTAKPDNLTVATPSAYEPVQKPVAVNNNGAPVQTVQSAGFGGVSNSNLLMAGSALVLVVALVLIAKN